MRSLYALAAAALLATIPVHATAAPPAHVQNIGVGGVSNGDTFTIPVSAPVTAGNTIILAVVNYPGGGINPTITDAGNNTYSFIGGGGCCQTSAAAYWAYVATGLPAGSTITYTRAGAVGGYAGSAAEFSGDWSSRQETNLTNFGGPPTYSVGPMTTTWPDELVYAFVAAVGPGPTAAIDPTFTALPVASTGGQMIAPAYKISATPGAHSFSGGIVNAVDWVANIQALQIGAPDNFVLGEGLGQGNGNRVKALAASGAATAVDFSAYAGGWGTNVATADVNGVLDEILTAPGPGPSNGPQIRAFDRTGAALAKVNFFAYGTLKYGANVAGGDLDGDGFGEILTGPGPGPVFGPQVRAYNFDGAVLTSIAKINLFAYGTLKYGVNVALGNLDADPFSEILTGAGPSSTFAPTVRAFNYDAASVSTIAKINYNALTGAYGINVAGGDVDADGFSEILAARGPDPNGFGDFVAHDYDGTSVTALPGASGSPFVTRFGARIGSGDTQSDLAWELIIGAGRDPAAVNSQVYVFGYSGGALFPVNGGIVSGMPTAYGTNVTGGTLGI